MGLSTAGRDYIAQSIISSTPTLFDENNTCIGVGDGTDPYDKSDTSLTGSDTFRKPVDSVNRDTNSLEFSATFTETEAQFAWNEWAVFNAETSGVMLNRKQESLGTKSGGVWVLTVTLEINVGA